MCIRDRGHEAVLLGITGGRLVAHQGQDVLVEDVALAVGQLLEAGECGVDLAFALHLHTQVLQPLLKSVAARDFAQHDLVGAPAHVFGTHDLVGVAGLEHAVLVDAAGVGKSVGAHHGLVGLHHNCLLYTSRCV